MSYREKCLQEICLLGRNVLGRNVLGITVLGRNGFWGKMSDIHILAILALLKVLKIIVILQDNMNSSKKSNLRFSNFNHMFTVQG